MLQILILLILFVIILLPVGAAKYLVNKFCRNRCYSYEETLLYSIPAGHLVEDPRTRYPWSPFSFQTEDGLLLLGQRLEKNPEKVMILVHGHRSHWIGMAKYMDRLIEDNWSIVTFDHRYHGSSPGDFCSGGLYEKKDLLGISELVRSWYPKAKVGFWGESMGSAILLQTLALAPPVDLAVAICPYSDLDDLFRYHFRRHGILWIAQQWGIFWARIFFRRITGGDIEEVSPKRAVENSRIPFLLVHGDADTYVPTSMSRDIDSHNKEFSELLIIPGGTHAMSFIQNPEVFWTGIFEFLKKTAP